MTFETLDEVLKDREQLRAELAQYETVIIPSWKREEAMWREDEANAVEFRRVLAEELDKRDSDIARLITSLSELLRLLESCTTAEYGYSAKIKAKSAIDACLAEKVKL